ncbi:protein kinase [Nonomuraea sp. NPDC050547]|uniref:serine/threonine-protein kinase n=1 Tax=Nonomuraea sp. NPDC050547 TaxID=3364368 RepID=UPI00378F6C30
MLALLDEDPRAVGPYRLQGRLGAGGQGTVYIGRTGQGAPVAIKLLHPHLIADLREQQRFLREVETAKRVAPFCTAHVLDSGFVGARPYIVSEYVQGPSLQASVRDNGARGAAALQRLAVNTATALAAIHEAGVVHRDFKPGNVLLGPDGPVVIDFGIARALDLSQSVVSSQPIGSPAYMAPEQIAGGDIGAAADIFAWGATMVYAATGQRAFVGDSIPGILHLILQGDPDLGELDGPLRLLLGECLAKDPAQRPTAAQVIERLRALPPPAWDTVPVRRTAATGFAAPDVPGLPAAAGPPTTPVAVAPPRARARRGQRHRTAGAGRRGAAGTRGPAPGAPPPPRGGGPPGGGGGPRGLLLGTAGAVLLAAAVTGYFALAPGASGNHAALTTPAAAKASVPGSPTSAPAPSTPAPSTHVGATPAVHGTPAPGATKRSQSAKAVPPPSGTPHRATPSATRKAPRTQAPVEPTDAAPTRKPTHKPTAKPTSAPPSEPAAPSQAPITLDDAHAYCKTQGASMAAGGWANLWCMGGSNAKISASTVCQWKYPGRNAVAEQPQNGMAQEVTCRLS